VRGPLQSSQIATLRLQITSSAVSLSRPSEPLPVSLSASRSA
jgi:hypothetical protein